MNESGLNEASLNDPAETLYFEYPKGEISWRRYSCVITGTPDVSIPISSLTLRATNSGISTLTVVCSNGADYADLIADRIDGGIVITATEGFSDGSEGEIIWDEYAISAISDSEGPTNYSVTITAKLTVVNPAPKKIALSGFSLITRSLNGVSRVRADPDKDLLPDDIAIVNGVELLVTQITTYISESGVNMEVTDG